MARLLWLYLPAALGCGTVVDDPRVDYGDAKPLGAWTPATAQTTFETEGLEAEPDSASTGPAAGSPGIATAPATTRPGAPMTAAPGSKPSAAAGAPATGSAGAAAPSGAPKPAGAAGAAAPSGGSEVDPGTTAPAETAGVTMLQISYTTESLGGRYAPKNVGAVWVTDSSGKLVKSVEVWARIRLRYLLNYAEVRGGARPDVTATATLSNHKAHMASWDLKGATGAAVPPGKYTLHAEVTDSHMDGKVITVPFDTSAGPTTIEAPPSPGFKSMTLTLQ